MNTAEASYLNNSFEGLSRSLLQNRMLQQQAEENMRKQLLERAMMDQRGALAGQELAQRNDQFNATMGLHREELKQRATDQTDARANRAAVLDLEKARQEKDATYQNRMLEKQDALLNNQQSKAALDQLSQAHESLSRDVTNGIKTPEQADAEAARIVAQIQAAPNVILRASPFAAMLDAKGGKLFTAPAPKEPRGSRETINLDRVYEYEQQAQDAELRGDKARAAQLRQDAADLRKSTFNAQTTMETLDVKNVPQVAQTTYQTLLDEKAKHNVELSQGDEHYGVTQFIPREGTSRTNRIAQIDKSLAALEKSYPELRKLRPMEPGETGPAAQGTAAPPMTLAPAGSNDVVRVQAPDGKTGTIPRAQLQEAVKAGYKPIR